MTKRNVERQSQQSETRAIRSQLAQISDEKELLIIERAEIMEEIRQLEEQLTPMSAEEKLARAAFEEQKSQNYNLKILVEERMKAFQEVVQDYEASVGKNSNLEEKIGKLQYEIDHGSQTIEREAQMKRQVSQLETLVLHADDFKSAFVQLKYLKKLESDLKAEYNDIMREWSSNQEMEEVSSQNKKIRTSIAELREELEESKGRIDNFNKSEKQLIEQLKTLTE